MSDRPERMPRSLSRWSVEPTACLFGGHKPQTPPSPRSCGGEGWGGGSGRIFGANNSPPTPTNFASLSWSTLPANGREGGLAARHCPKQSQQLLKHILPAGQARRTGALHDGMVVDLCGAYAKYAFEKNGEAHPVQLAEAMVPSDLARFIEGGSRALEQAGAAVDYLFDQAAASRAAPSSSPYT